MMSVCAKLYFSSTASSASVLIKRYTWSEHYVKTLLSFLESNKHAEQLYKGDISPTYFCECYFGGEDETKELHPYILACTFNLHLK